MNTNHLTQKQSRARPADPRPFLLQKYWAALLVVLLPLPRTMAQTEPAAPASGLSAAPVDSRPAHLWTTGYANLLWDDTKTIVTSPARWNTDDWTNAGLAMLAIGGTAAFDQTIKENVQAHVSQGQSDFMKRFQNLGAGLSFGILAGFEVWGEAGDNSKAKAVAMDGLAASLIGPGLIGTSVKYVAGRVRPNETNDPFIFKPFSGNASFPSGHTAQAFAVATTIAEHYPVWWVQGLCYGSAAVVGYARIEENAHWASDVVAGGILGWSVAHTIVRRHDKPPKPGRLAWMPYANGTGAGLICHKSF